MRVKGYTALWNLLMAGVIFVALGITLSIGADVVHDVGATFGSTTSHAYNATVDAEEGIANLAEWTPTIGTVVAAGGIIAIIMASFVVYAFGASKQAGL